MLNRKLIWILIVLLALTAGATIFVIVNDMPSWVDLSLIDPNDHVVTKTLRVGQYVEGGHTEAQPGVTIEYEILTGPNDFTWDFNEPNTFIWEYKPLAVGIAYARVSADPNQDGVPGTRMYVTYAFRTLEALTASDTWWIRLFR